MSQPRDPATFGDYFRKHAKTVSYTAETNTKNKPNSQFLSFQSRKTEKTGPFIYFYFFDKKKILFLFSVRRRSNPDLTQI